MWSSHLLKEHFLVIKTITCSKIVIVYMDCVYCKFLWYVVSKYTLDVVHVTCVDAME